MVSFCEEDTAVVLVKPYKDLPFATPASLKLGVLHPSSVTGPTPHNQLHRQTFSGSPRRDPLPPRKKQSKSKMVKALTGLSTPGLRVLAAFPFLGLLPTWFCSVPEEAAPFS